MLSLKELKKKSILTEEDVAFRYVVSVLCKVKAKDEYLIVDRGGYFHDEQPISKWRNFYYSHLCEGGCYYFAFGLDFFDKDNLELITVTPARDRGEPKQFSLTDPKAVDLKSYMRKIMDHIKKETNRKPWW